MKKRIIGVIVIKIVFMQLLLFTNQKYIDEIKNQLAGIAVVIS